MRFSPCQSGLIHAGKEVRDFRASAPSQKSDLFSVQGIVFGVELRRVGGRPLHRDRLGRQEGHGLRSGVTGVAPGAESRTTLCELAAVKLRASEF